MGVLFLNDARTFDKRIQTAFKDLTYKRGPPIPLLRHDVDKGGEEDPVCLSMGHAPALGQAVAKGMDYHRPASREQKAPFESREHHLRPSSLIGGLGESPRQVGMYASYGALGE